MVCFGINMEKMMKKTIWVVQIIGIAYDKFEAKPFSTKQKAEKYRQEYASCMWDTYFSHVTKSDNKRLLADQFFQMIPKNKCILKIDEIEIDGYSDVSEV